jgi:hypothetical protein
MPKPITSGAGDSAPAGYGTFLANLGTLLCQVNGLHFGPQRGPATEADEHQIMAVVLSLAAIEARVLDGLSHRHFLFPLIFTP